MPRPKLRRDPPSDITDLSATLEALAARIGDRIGESIARALSAQAPAPGPEPRRHCAREGCEKPVAAKGLCKSHYNLMLYHRRKARPARGSRPPAAKRARAATPKKAKRPRKHR